MILFLLALFTSAFTNANIGTYGFKNFKNYYFVETGTFGGGAIKKALQAGFQEIHSMDINPDFVHFCRQEFKDCPNVFIKEGNSASDLWETIKNMDKPITFWLDAHIFPPVEGEKNAPLIEELAQIKRHPIKTHTILIDDMNCCGQLAFDYLTKEQLMEEIRKINPEYVFEFLPGGDDSEVPDNVLVAYVPSKINKLFNNLKQLLGL